jgi:hypothetical protein
VNFFANNFFLRSTNEVEIILGSAYQNSDSDEGKLIISFPSIGGGEACCFLTVAFLANYS